ncbi:MAG TPA: M20/M25/M40 family metallo-hydrolase [Candidatus Angelobacter sp.]|nr:M20/M25/M40 family metallo-hydrolase [Candidatus Angelobacter sp.]
MGFIIARMHWNNLKRVTVIAVCLSSVVAIAQQPPAQSTRRAVRDYRQQHEADIVRDYAALLSLPNVASDTANIRANADFISKALEARGFQTRLLSVPGSPPAVYGELTAPGAKHTLLWYAHYDGQPVDKSQWADDPWKPVLRDGPLEAGGKAIPLDSLHPLLNPEWRIYARAAGDDKAPIQALFTALDALHAAKLPLSVNLKVFFEGEEEAGSPHLESIFRENASLLKGDVWILSDGPVNQTRRMQVFFGARGVTDLEMIVYGPARVLHSGHYGNWAPNPAALLVDLLSNMRDPTSHILIPGYYDDVRPLGVSEGKALAQMPDVDAQLRQELALAWTESKGATLATAISEPALNIRGIESGHVESKAQNAIPTYAKASIDFRLVPDQSPEKVKVLVERFIGEEGFFIVHQEPDLETRRKHPKVIKLSWGAGGYKAAQTPIDDPAVQPVIRAIEQTLGGPIIKMPMLGGSIPMYLFTDLLKTPVFGLPIANHDDNQHAANENLRLQNLWDGIDIFAGVLTGTEANWR